MTYKIFRLGMDDLDIIRLGMDNHSFLYSSGSPDHSVPFFVPLVHPTIAFLSLFLWFT